MIVLLLSQYFWPESFRINDVVESLRRVGCHVTVLTGQPNYPQGKVFGGYRAAGFGVQQHEAGYSIYRVPLAPREFWPIGRADDTKNSARDRRIWRRRRFRVLPCPDGSTQGDQKPRPDCVCPAEDCLHTKFPGERRYRHPLTSSAQPYATPTRAFPGQ